MSTTLEQGVCKVVRSLGFSPKRTHAITDGVIRDIHHNGAEWVISRLKGLKSYYAGDGEFPAWIRKCRRKDGTLRPKGWMGSLVGSRTDARTVITALATLQNSVVMSDPTDKQLDKWKSSVTDPPLSSLDSGFPMFSNPSFERKLKAKLEKVEAFGPDNIKGTRIPVGFEEISLKRGKRLDGASLYRAYIDTVKTAPSVAWSFSDESGIRIPGMPMKKARPILNRLRKEAPDSGKTKVSWKKGKSGRTLPKLEDYPVGHISFLQEPGGKLRTVANPNRYVQWLLTPLGETLSEMINSRPGVYVLDQEAGIAWVQAELQKGTHLTSMDLSSASDTLDYTLVTNSLKKAGPEMKKHIQFFEKCSSMPWYLTNETAKEYLGSSVVRWKQGQPLGLRPSFPVLTMCNFAAAFAAVKAVDGKVDIKDIPFAIVGDDIVIRSRYAEEYHEVISGMGGILNMDKSMSSDRQAEFCSRLIRPKEVIRLKARYLHDNDPQNLLTYQDTSLTVRMKPWVRRQAQRIGSYSLVESGLVPEFNGDQPKSLSSKELFHAGLSLSNKGKATVVEKSSHSLWLASVHEGKDPSQAVRPVSKKVKRISQDSEPSGSLAALDQMMKDDVSRLLGELAREPAMRARVPEIFVEREYSDTPTDFEIASAREQKVESAYTSYNWKSDRHEPDQNPDSHIRSLGRKVRQHERDQIQDSDGSHSITRVGPQVDRLIEDKGDAFEVSYFSPLSQSPVELIGKLLQEDDPGGSVTENEEQPHPDHHLEM